MRNDRYPWQRRAAGLVLALCSAGVVAQDAVVIYRCTDAQGAVTIQNDVRCPKGSRQERRVVEAAPANAATPARPPAPPVAPVAPAAATPAPAAVPASPPLPAPEPDTVTANGDEVRGERLPPPLLYECRTYDDDRYLSENGTPQQRCVTLTTTGLGGIAAGGAGAACEMKTDTCQQVPDGALCERWRQRLREAESALRFGVSTDRAFAAAEVERVRRIVSESVCSQ